MKNSVKIKCALSCLVVIFFVIVALGCSSQKEVFYNVSLSSVERPANPYEMYTGVHIVDLSSYNTNNYQDKFIDITWFYNRNSLDFKLYNKTDYPIKIDWNEVSYIDYDSLTKKIVHKDVNLVDMSKFMPCSMIPRKSYIEESIVPTNKIGFVPDYGWVNGEFLPSTFKENNKKIDEIASSFVGKHFMVLLPIYIEDVRNDYLFVFKITSYSIDSK